MVLDGKTVEQSGWERRGIPVIFATVQIYVRGIFLVIRVTAQVKSMTSVSSGISDAEADVSSFSSSKGFSLLASSVIKRDGICG